MQTDPQLAWCRDNLRGFDKYNDDVLKVQAEEEANREWARKNAKPEWIQEMERRNQFSFDMEESGNPGADSHG
jgi:hypothetical protein